MQINTKMKVRDSEKLGALGQAHCSPVMRRLVAIRESLPMQETSVTQGYLSPRDFRAPGAHFRVVESREVCMKCKGPGNRNSLRGLRPGCECLGAKTTLLHSSPGFPVDSTGWESHE